jgi:hypothetical protein
VVGGTFFLSGRTAPGQYGHHLPARDRVIDASWIDLIERLTAVEINQFSILLLIRDVKAATSLGLGSLSLEEDQLTSDRCSRPSMASGWWKP